MHASPNRHILLTLWGGLQEGCVFSWCFNFSRVELFFWVGFPLGIVFLNVINTSVTPCLRMGAAWIHADLGRLFAKLGPKGTKAGAVVMSDGIVEFCLDFEMAKIADVFFWANLEIEVFKLWSAMGILVGVVYMFFIWTRIPPMANVTTLVDRCSMTIEVEPWFERRYDLSFIPSKWLGDNDRKTKVKLKIFLSPEYRYKSN